MLSVCAVSTGQLLLKEPGRVKWIWRTPSDLFLSLGVIAWSSLLAKAAWVSDQEAQHFIVLSFKLPRMLAGSGVDFDFVNFSIGVVKSQRLLL